MRVRGQVSPGANQTRASVADDHPSYSPAINHCLRHDCMINHDAAPIWFHADENHPVTQ